MCGSALCARSHASHSNQTRSGRGTRPARPRGPRSFSPPSTPLDLAGSRPLELRASLITSYSPYQSTKGEPLAVVTFWIRARIKGPGDVTSEDAERAAGRHGRPEGEGDASPYARACSHGSTRAAGRLSAACSAPAARPGRPADRRCWRSVAVARHVRPQPQGVEATAEPRPATRRRPRRAGERARAPAAAAGLEPSRTRNISTWTQGARARAPRAARRRAPANDGARAA